MKALNHYTTYEDFETEMARELGLTLGLDRLRGATAGWPFARVTNSSTIPASTAQRDFETRYRACKTTAERVEFVRANKAEARRFLRTNAQR